MKMTTFCILLIMCILSFTDINGQDCSISGGIPLNICFTNNSIELSTTINAEYANPPEHSWTLISAPDGVNPSDFNPPLPTTNPDGTHLIQSMELTNPDGNLIPGDYEFQFCVNCLDGNQNCTTITHIVSPSPTQATILTGDVSSCSEAFLPIVPNIPETESLLIHPISPPPGVTIEYVETSPENQNQAGILVTYTNPQFSSAEIGNINIHYEITNDGCTTTSDTVSVFLEGTYYDENGEINSTIVSDDSEFCIGPEFILTGSTPGQNVPWTWTFFEGPENNPAEIVLSTSGIGGEAEVPFTFPEDAIDGDYTFIYTINPDECYPEVDTLTYFYNDILVETPNFIITNGGDQRFCLSDIILAPFITNYTAIQDNDIVTYISSIDQPQAGTVEIEDWHDITSNITFFPDENGNIIFNDNDASIGIQFCGERLFFDLNNDESFLFEIYPLDGNTQMTIENYQDIILEMAAFHAENDPVFLDSIYAFISDENGEIIDTIISCVDSFPGYVSSSNGSITVVDPNTEIPEASVVTFDFVTAPPITNSIPDVMILDVLVDGEITGCRIYVRTCQNCLNFSLQQLDDLILQTNNQSLFCEPPTQIDLFNYIIQPIGTGGNAQISLNSFTFTGNGDTDINPSPVNGMNLTTQSQFSFTTPGVYTFELELSSMDDYEDECSDTETLTFNLFPGLELGTGTDLEICPNESHNLFAETLPEIVNKDALLGMWEQVSDNEINAHIVDPYDMNTEVFFHPSVCDEVYEFRFTLESDDAICDNINLLSDNMFATVLGPETCDCNGCINLELDQDNFTFLQNPETTGRYDISTGYYIPFGLSPDQATMMVNGILVTYVSHELNDGQFSWSGYIDLPNLSAEEELCFTFDFGLEELCPDTLYGFPCEFLDVPNDICPCDCTINFENVPTDITLACGENIPPISAEISINSDCLNAELYFEEDLGDCSNTCEDRIITRTWTATTDQCEGYGVSISQTITILGDDTAPILSSPQDFIVECNGTIDIGQTFQDWLNAKGNILVTSDCCEQLSWSYEIISGSLPSECVEGTIVVAFTAIDACGRSTTTNANFTIINM